MLHAQMAQVVAWGAAHYLREDLRESVRGEKDQRQQGAMPRVGHAQSYAGAGLAAIQTSEVPWMSYLGGRVAIA